jgi:hypothetical protein
MKTTQSAFTCTATGTLVTRIRFYETISGIGQPNAGFDLIGERCSKEARCMFLPQCPMRKAP